MSNPLRFVGLLPMLAVAFAAPKATVADLLKDGKKYDGKAVEVVGPVLRFEQRTSRSGSSYFVFKLGTAKSFVSIYGRDKLATAPIDGAKVQVVGEFKVERRSGDRVFKNEIDASKKLNKTFGVKLL